MWQRCGRNRADNAWLDVGRALNISCSQPVASRLIRNRCHVLSVLILSARLIDSDAARVASFALQRGRTHACISQSQQCDSAAGAIELITHRVGRTLTLTNYQVFTLQSVASRLIRSRCRVLSFLINSDAAGVAPSALQRGRTHACISLRQQYDSAAGAISW